MKSRTSSNIIICKLCLMSDAWYFHRPYYPYHEGFKVPIIIMEVVCLASLYVRE